MAGPTESCRVKVANADALMALLALMALMTVANAHALVALVALMALVVMVVMADAMLTLLTEIISHATTHCFITFSNSEKRPSNSMHGCNTKLHTTKGRRKKGLPS